MTHEMSRRQYVILTEYDGIAPKCQNHDCNNDSTFEFSRFGIFCSYKCRATSPEHLDKSIITIKLLQQELADYKNTHNGMSENEYILWTNGKLDQLGFSYQRIINLNEENDFIREVDQWVRVDFLNEKSNIIIEVDGWSHDNRIIKDSDRDNKLVNLGYKVLRFTNDQVVNNFSSVIDSIKQYLKI
jgi:very-short-patch-repair endonuclease